MSASTSTLEETSMTQTNEVFKDVVCGSVAGAFAKLIEYPFDTVKVRLQSQSLVQPQYQGPLDCFRQSISSDGIISGLYRGVSAPIVGSAIETSSLFFTYRLAQDFFASTIYGNTTPQDHAQMSERETRLPFNALLCCGAMSGASTSLLLTPIELVKCQMQIPLAELQLSATKTGIEINRRSSLLDIVLNTFKQHGIFGFWHGQLGTLIRETGGSAAWFGSYEACSAAFRRYEASKRRQSNDGSSSAPEKSHFDATGLRLPVHQQLFAGALAGVAYNFVCFPADTIKSRMQTEDVRAPTVSTAAFDGKSGAFSPHEHENSALPNSRARQTFWSAGSQLWKEQGMRGLYRGCGITLMRAAPSSAVIFAVYEGLRGYWD